MEDLSTLTDEALQHAIGSQIALNERIHTLLRTVVSQARLRATRLQALTDELATRTGNPLRPMRIAQAEFTDLMKAADKPDLGIVDASFSAGGHIFLNGPRWARQHVLDARLAADPKDVPDADLDRLWDALLHEEATRG